MLNAMMGGATGAARTGAGAEGADAEQKGVIDGESEQMDVPLRPEEKKRLDWREELYLAPLTTVGNLVRCLAFSVVLAFRHPRTLCGLYAIPMRNLCTNPATTRNGEQSVLPS